MSGGAPLMFSIPLFKAARNFLNGNHGHGLLFFLGLSKKHAASIPLVLNLTLLHISPQFHVIFDDWFTTVASSLETDDSLIGRMIF